MNTKQDRLKILSRHPALSARHFEFQQNSFWECIILGEDKPLDEVSDYWRRQEASN